MSDTCKYQVALGESLVGKVCCTNMKIKSSDPQNLHKKLGVGVHTHNPSRREGGGVGRRAELTELA